jgi:hypothetical protein
MKVLSKVNAMKPQDHREDLVKLNNPVAYIVPFEDIYNPAPDLAWIYWNGNRSLYSDTLIAVLRHRGYIIEDLRTSADVTILKEDEF